jgi:poly-beta-hydroxybutyrate-responsive repressor
MPQGYRSWPRGSPDQICPRRIQRFLEPCLLLLLHCHQAHGYELLEGLKPFGFGQNPADLSTVYRILRDLEDRGFAVSHWDTGNPGPARRQYTLTEEGDRYLAWWVQDLRETDRALRCFLDRYEAHMEIHG